MNEGQTDSAPQFLLLRDDTSWPDWCSRAQLVDFLHTTMKPYEDQPADIDNAITYAFSGEKYAGGFIMLVEMQGRLAGALVMLNTGMGGYVPENILLFVSVNPEMRGHGIGGELIRRCIAECDGQVKLHVDFGNPAKRLYERLGFVHVYDEMRYKR
ncbi:GNAT family N-acetyltransferase [bacterium]|nr:GNAT family N-acetyltransferase [bacterium]